MSVWLGGKSPKSNLGLNIGALYEHIYKINSGQSCGDNPYTECPLVNRRFKYSFEESGDIKIFLQYEPSGFLLLNKVLVCVKGIFALNILFKDVFYTIMYSFLSTRYSNTCRKTFVNGSQFWWVPIICIQQSPSNKDTPSAKKFCPYQRGDL